MNIRKTLGGVWPKPNQSWSEIISQAGRKSVKKYHEQQAKSNYNPSWWFRPPSEELIMDSNDADYYQKMYQDGIKSLK